jgi:succinate dehydrogenase / fumarate reductase membrane anchor subunit
MRYQTDRQRVEGLGTAHEGVGHWWGQRVTAVAMVPLTLFFVFPFVRSLGASWVEVQALYSTPLHAVVAILFLLVGFRHLHYGMQVVIEDYVHDKPLRTASMLGNTMICWGLAMTGVFAVAKLAFA